MQTHRTLPMQDIKNYRFVCDINSEKVKENIIEVGVNLKLSPVEKSTDKIKLK